MQKTTLATIYFALCAFSLFAIASPVGKDVSVVRNSDPLSTILAELADLKSKIASLLGAIAATNTNINFSDVVAQVIALLKKILLDLKPIGTVADGDKDKIADIASTVVDIIKSLVDAFGGLSLLNLLEILNIATLDATLQTLLKQLNLNIPGILALIAQTLGNPLGLLNLLLSLLPLTCSLLNAA